MIIQTSTSNVLNILSYSEMKAVKALYEHLDERKEAEIVVSRVSENLSIARSVFVNAAGKLEACGVIRTESMGMKGLYVKVVNQEAFKIIAEG